MYINGSRQPHYFGKTRSQHEKNLKKAWGCESLNPEQQDKLKFQEKKEAWKGAKKNLITGIDIDRVQENVDIY